MSTYKVGSGDTLSKIAKQHGLSVQELVDMNGIKDANKIQIGQVLKLKPEESSKLTTPTNKTKPIGLGSIPGLAGIDYGVAALGQMYAQANENKTNYTLDNVPVEHLQEVYQNGPGFGNAASSMIYHVIAPEAMSMPHTDNLKDQIAAAIAYSESLPPHKRERDSDGVSVDEDGYQYIGYGTYGKLTGQSDNVNKQGTKGNATSKVMGGLRYKFNEDGSVDVKDAYGFNVVRDFSRLNKDGKPAVLKDKTTDPYMGRPLRGLIHDLRQEHSNLFSGQGIQDLAENYGTRQGKVRNNSLHFDSGEIERRINS